MHIEDLKLMLLLLEHRNLTKVAEMVHVSQPAVAIKLGKLRDYFKDELLIRQGNQMLLTEKAQSLFHPVERLVTEFEQLTPQTSSFNPNLENNFKIKLSEAASDLLTESIVNAILSYNPKHHISIETISRFHDNIKDPDHDPVDLVITGEGYAYQSFHKEILFKDDFCVVYDQYFTTQIQQLTVKEYLDLPHLVFTSKDDTNSFLQYLSTPDPRNIIARVNSLRTALHLLKDKYVITATTIIADLYGYHFIPLPFETEPICLKALCPNRLRFDPKNQWLRKICHQIVKQKLNEARK